MKNSTPRPPDDWVRLEAPELRIVSDDLWHVAQERLKAARGFYLQTTGRRPPSVLAAGKYLLSGLASCADCGGAMIVRSRASGGERRFVYSCGYHHTRGRSVCANALLAPMEATNHAVLEAIDSDALNPRVLARAADDAIAILCPPADAIDQQRAVLLGQIRQLDAELANLAEAIAKPGGEIPALLQAAKDRDVQRVRCVQQLAALESSRRLGRLERARVDRQVRDVLTDWQGLLTRHMPQAREVLRNVLEGRLIFEPNLKERIYTFSGEISVGRLLLGAVPAHSAAFNSGGGPNGTRANLHNSSTRFHCTLIIGSLQPRPPGGPGAGSWSQRGCGGPQSPISNTLRFEVDLV
jgi:hypothetical protein